MDIKDPKIIEQLAPDGVLRIAINFGNAILAQPTEKGEKEKGSGVSVVIAKQLAKDLELDYELIFYNSAGRVFNDIENDSWRIAFLAQDPVRAEKLAFTDPYVLIEGTYLVPEGSSIFSIDDLDVAGHRISVGKGAVYDLFLTRDIKLAELVRAETTEGAIHLFAAEQLTAAAGIREGLQNYAASHTGYRVLDDAFLEIRQSMVTHKNHSAAAEFLNNYLAELKQTDLIRNALVDSGMPTTLAAP